MEVCTIDLTLNLLLSRVIFTHVTTNNSESTNSSIVKLLNVCIYIFLRSIKTLNLMAEKETKKSNLHESRSVKISETLSALIFSYFFESSLMQNFICLVYEYF